MKTDTFTLSSGEEIPIIFVTKVGVRNIVLRPKTMPRRELHITLPRWTSESRAMKFVAEKQQWLSKIFARAPEKACIKDGDVIVIFGRNVLIRHDAKGRAGVYMQDGDSPVMCVCGASEMLERRVRDEIKKQFLAAVKKEIAALPVPARPKRIAVRDTTSRWGSYSATGTLSLSYRLSFAPPAVMRYVIMHELAHMRHMDHSPKFWAYVRELYGPGMERAKQYLSKNGQSLHRYF